MLGTRAGMAPIEGSDAADVVTVTNTTVREFDVYGRAVDVFEDITRHKDATEEEGEINIHTLRGRECGAKLESRPRHQRP